MGGKGISLNDIQNIHYSMIFDIDRQLSEFHKYGQLPENLFRKKTVISVHFPAHAVDRIFDFCLNMFAHRTDDGFVSVQPIFFSRYKDPAVTPRIP